MGCYCERRRIAPGVRLTYIRYMAVCGFKSLRDWNLLEFAPGVSVIVGGNGTGKTSLVEALLWALGEDDADALGIVQPRDLLFDTSPAATRSFEPEDVLFHRPAKVVDSTPAEPSAAPDGAVVYLVMGQEADLGRGADGDEACCRMPGSAGSIGDLPTGSLTVGRSLDRDGNEAWLLDGEPAAAATVERALRSHHVDRGLALVVRQGELERVLDADDALRARIIGEAAGISGDAASPLRDRLLALDAEGEWLAEELDRLDHEIARVGDDVGEAEAVSGSLIDGGTSWGVGKRLEAPLASLRAEALAAAGFTERSYFPLLGLPLPDGDPRDLETVLSLIGIFAGAEQAGGRYIQDSLGRVHVLREERKELGRWLQRWTEERSSVLADLEALRAEQTAALEGVCARVGARAGRYFDVLVPGGELSLLLTTGDAGDGADEPRVEVRAAFPGEIEVHLDALSGGQRALAAFALGVAVLEEMPSRLMVLDEVEPALDESNLRRFNGLLHEIATTRQVVIVSHQRRTREVGDVVFGVDHANDGASALLFRFEPKTRSLVMFGRSRGNWLERNGSELDRHGDETLPGPRSPGRTVQVRQ
jgi:hypothetical protein